MTKLGATQLSFRLPAEILAQLRKAADEERRSVSAQVLVIVEDWLAERGHAVEDHETPHRPTD